MLFGLPMGLPLLLAFAMPLFTLARMIESSNSANTADIWMNTETMVTIIADVEIASLPREGAEAFPKLDMSACTKYTFSMFGGETVPVTMVFQNRMMGTVMDRFGRDVVVMKEDKRHFRITVPVAVSNQFYGWVFGLGKAVRIIGLESVKEA